MLKCCWLDIYLGPLDVIIVDAGTNFILLEFKAEARLTRIIYYQIPVETY